MGVLHQTRRHREAQVLAMQPREKEIQLGMRKEEEVKTDDGCDCLSRLRPGGEIYYYSDVLFQLHTGPGLEALFLGCLNHCKKILRFPSCKGCIERNIFISDSHCLGRALQP